MCSMSVRAAPRCALADVRFQSLLRRLYPPTMLTQHPPSINTTGIPTTPPTRSRSSFSFLFLSGALIPGCRLGRHRFAAVTS